jgi:oxalate decarboxylase/phosphoglucose isomerase-like protein (cupin superfamily)
LLPIEVVRDVPIPVVRAFFVFDIPANTERGGHAHRYCSQFMVCLGGAIDLQTFDGAKDRTIRLEEGCGILIPPAIHCTEVYSSPNLFLIVFCDKPYDVHDYIDEKDVLADLRRDGGAYFTMGRSG